MQSLANRTSESKRGNKDVPDIILEKENSEDADLCLT